MLTPDQITALRDISGQLLDPVIEYLIEDITQRVSEAGQLTSTAAYETWRLQNLGVSQDQLKKEIQKRLKVSQAQVEQLMTQAAQAGYDFDVSRFPTVDAIPFEENTSLQQILNAAVKLAKQDLSNITQTIGFVTASGNVEDLTTAYNSVCDYAFMKVITGAQDYNSAIRDATRGLAQKGIRFIDYASGVHTSIEAAVRRNIMGGLGLMVEQITQQNHDDLGCDGWEISAHGGCAPDHEPIQGKQYTDKAYTQLNNSLVRRIGTLNCGHTAMPIIMGVNDPQYTNEELEEFRRQNEEGVTYNGKHYTLYEATQRQRRLETSIRNRKHRILIDEQLGDKDALQNDQIRLQLLKQEYTRFSKAAKLPMQYERMEIAGFDWKKGKEAEKAVLAQRGLDPSADLWYTSHSDRGQFERYRKVLKNKVPESYEEFRQMKEKNPSAWDILKRQYRIVNQYKVDVGEFTADEILELDDQLITEKRENFISRLKRSGNVAGAYVDKDYYLAHSSVSTFESAKGYRGSSKIVTLRTNRSFQYVDVKKQDGSIRTGTFHDTEAKLFEEFASMYSQKPFKSITMISERGMCDSCKSVMKQFMARFPDVKVRVISNKKVEGDVWKYRRRKK